MITARVVHVAPPQKCGIFDRAGYSTLRSSLATEGGSDLSSLSPMPYIVKETSVNLRAQPLLANPHFPNIISVLMTILIRWNKSIIEDEEIIKKIRKPLDLWDEGTLLVNLTCEVT